ncbi:MAG: hypothetical protein V8S92_00590 [Oscillospiraceae bacterium]
MYGRRLHHKTARDADRRQTVLYHVCISGRTPATPTDKLIACIDAELEKEAHSA